MGNINDFKLVKLKSRKMFDYIGVDETKSISEVAKERLGFYHLVLENITGITDAIDEDKESGQNNQNDTEDQDNGYTIIDTEYNKLVYDRVVDDLGIDAVYITKGDKGEIEIKLFNFKYRTKFNPDKTKSENDISRSTKFLEYITKEKELNTEENKIVAQIVNKILNHLDSNTICNITLYMVSNEAKGFACTSNDYIKLLEEKYGMKVVNISLDEIISFFNEKKSDYSSKFMISDSEFLSFQSDEKSTKKSYILKLSLLDLIRITAEDESLTNKYSLEDDDEIKEAQLDISLLYDNVRGFLGEKTKYNKNIIETLKNQHHKFFMFNNGITLTAEKIECTSKNSGKKYLFEIENFQIVNGGQTLRSIYSFLNTNSDPENLVKLRESFVLLRIFKIDKDDLLKNAIAEYTNSQNAISDVDLKSIDVIQIQIEKYFSEFDILYTRKAGDIGEIDKDYRFRIYIQRLAQILYSSIGYPDRASNQKRRLFQDYYNEIFKSEKFSLEKSKELVEKAHEIENVYKANKSKYKMSDQKVFYVIYIITFAKYTIEDAIERLEKLLIDFDYDGADSRKLIQKGFKHFVNKELGIELK